MKGNRGKKWLIREANTEEKREEVRRMESRLENGMRQKIEYQVIYDEGEDVDTYATLADARRAYFDARNATELRKVIWHPVQDFRGQWIPLSEDAEREDRTLEEKEGKNDNQRNEKRIAGMKEDKEDENSD